MNKTTKIFAILFLFTLVLLQCTCSLAAPKAKEENLFVSGRPTIICFGGSYCPACKLALPALKAMQKKYNGRATILYLDVEKDRSLARDFPLQVIPTYFFYDKNGKIYLPSKKVAEKIEFNQRKDWKTGKAEWQLHMGALSEEDLEAILADLGVK